MTEMSDFLEIELLDHVLKGDAYTAPTDPYAALYTATPSDSGGGTEVSGSAYARTIIPFTDAAAAGSIDNSADCTFPTASGGNWGTVTHMSIMDASTAGNFLFWAPLAASKVVNDADTFKFAAGDLIVNLD